MKQAIVIRTDLKMGKGKIYSRKNYLKGRLKTGKTYKQIAFENNIGKSTVQRYLNKYKLTNPSMQWTKNEISLLKKHYLIGRISLKDLLKNRTHSSIYHKANKLGLKRLVKPLKYSMDEEFFNNWSKEMAYFLGWLYSDGNVSKDLRNFSIHIGLKDINILKTFKKYLNSNHPIKIYKNSAKIIIYSKIMCKKLVELGCVPKKSLIIEFPNIPNKYINHFIRGFFDGDGSIYFNKPNTIKVVFMAPKKFINSIQKVLKMNVGVSVTKIKYYHKLYICHYYGNSARKICYWMYKGCQDLYLRRKRILFLNHIKKRKNLINGRYL